MCFVACWPRGFKKTAFFNWMNRYFFVEVNDVFIRQHQHYGLLPPIARFSNNLQWRERRSALCHRVETLTSEFPGRGVGYPRAKSVKFKRWNGTLSWQSLAWTLHKTCRPQCCVQTEGCVTQTAHISRTTKLQSNKTKDQRLSADELILNILMSQCHASFDHQNRRLEDVFLFQSFFFWQRSRSLRHRCTSYALNNWRFFQTFKCWVDKAPRCLKKSLAHMSTR